MYFQLPLKISFSFQKYVKIVIYENDQEIPQTLAPQEEPHIKQETPGRQTKQSKQLSLPHQDDCKTIIYIK